MGMKPRSNSITLFEDAARSVFANALTVAAMNGDEIVRGGCGHCDYKRGKTACVLCAVLLYRGIDTKMAMRKGLESTVAKLLSLPEAWVIDLVTGFDGDDTPVTYGTARSIGKRLWKMVSK